MNWKRRVVDCEPERPIRVYVPAGEIAETAKSWTIRVRGAPSTYEAAEYECPKHGRFEITVLRSAPESPACAYIDREVHGPWTQPPCFERPVRVFPSPGIGTSSGDVTS